MGLIGALGRGPVCIDTSIFIYYLEENPTYFKKVTQLFSAIEAGSITAVTSGITLLETTVLPLRKGNRPLANRYADLLTNSYGLRLVPLSFPLLRDAALIRAQTRMKTPDALQLAAALREQCTALITNDRGFATNLGVQIIQIDQYI